MLTIPSIVLFIFLVINLVVFSNPIFLEDEKSISNCESIGVGRTYASQSPTETDSAYGFTFIQKDRPFPRNGILKGFNVVIGSTGSTNLLIIRKTVGRNYEIIHSFPALFEVRGQKYFSLESDTTTYEVKKGDYIGWSDSNRGCIEFFHDLTTSNSFSCVDRRYRQVGQLIPFENEGNDNRGYLIEAVFCPTNEEQPSDPKQPEDPKPTPDDHQQSDHREDDDYTNGGDEEEKVEFFAVVILVSIIAILIACVTLLFVFSAVIFSIAKYGNRELFRKLFGGDALERLNQAENNEGELNVNNDENVGEDNINQTSMNELMEIQKESQAFDEELKNNVDNQE